MTAERAPTPGAPTPRAAGTRVLGIDPGLTITGYGVIDSLGTEAKAVTWGAIRPNAKGSRADRLAAIFKRIGALIDEYLPDEVAIEQQFVKDNVRTALAIGEARAAAMVAAAIRGLPVFEYAPASIKEAVTGTGAAPKEQVQAMVVMHLGLSEPPEPLDAADALAVAITRLTNARFEAILASSRRSGRP